MDTLLKEQAGKIEVVTAFFDKCAYRFFDDQRNRLSTEPIAWWFNAYEGLDEICQYHHCHATMKFQPGRKPVFWATGYRVVTKECLPGNQTRYIEGTSEAALAFLDWILSESSPWKTLLGGGYHILKGKDDLPCGVVLPAEAVGYDNWYTYFNFCVALRGPREYPVTTLVWHNLVKAGMDPAIALYCARYYAIDSFGNYSATGSRNNGSHWPLNDYYWTRSNKAYYREYGGKQLSTCFDWDKYLNGRDEHHVDSSTKVWESPIKEIGGDYDAYEVPASTNQQATRFSKIETLTLEKIIEHFMAWFYVQAARRKTVS